MSDFARQGIEEEQRRLASMPPGPPEPIGPRDTFGQRFAPIEAPEIPGLAETYARARLPYMDRYNPRTEPLPEYVGPDRVGPDWLYQTPGGKEAPGLEQQIEQDKMLAGLVVPTSLPEAGFMAATGGLGGTIPRVLGKLGASVLGAAGAYGMMTDPAQAGVLGTAGKVLRGAAAKEAWLGPDIEAKLASTKHPYSAVAGTPIRDMPAPSYRETVTFDRPEINFDQLQPVGGKPQYAFIPTPGDASIAGKEILGAAGQTFEHPVSAYGGPDFGRMMKEVGAPVPGNPNAFPVWQSQAAPMGTISNIAKEVEAKGMQPLAVYTTGGKKYLDQSMQMVDTAIEGAKASGLSQKQIDFVNSVMKSDKLGVPGIADFPSLELLKHGEDGALAFYNKLLDYPQPVRSKFVKSMDSGEARSLGFPDMGALRVANTVPELLTTPPGSMGFTISKLDPSSGTFKNPYHPTYNTGMGGTEIYTLPGSVSVPPSEIVPTMHAARQDVGGTVGNLYRAQPHSFYPVGPKGSGSYEPVTNEVLDRLRNYLRINPQGVTAIGGTVAGAAALSPDQAEAANLKMPPSFGGLVRGAAELPAEATKLVKTLAPQGTVNWTPAWMLHPERWFPDMPKNVVVDPSMPMDLESRLARRANSPFKEDVYHFSGQRYSDPNRDLPVKRTASSNQFSQFKLDRPGQGYDFGIHVGTPSQAEARAYHQEHARFGNPLNPAEGPLGSGGHTYPLAADFGPKGMLTATDETTWGPLITKFHLQNTGQFTPEEIAKATAQLTPTEQLQAYRDLVRSHGYGGLQYRNQVEAEGTAQLEREKDRLMMLRDIRDKPEGTPSRSQLQNKIDDLEQKIMDIKVNTTAKSYAIADPSQLRSRFMAIYDPRNLGKSFLAGSVAGTAAMPLLGDLVRQDRYQGAY